MTALIDFDSVLYRCLFAGQRDGIGYYRQLGICETILEGILDTLKPDQYELVITGSGNFRNKIAATYKANRDPANRPTYLHDSKKYFTKYWEAVLTKGIEADDYISMSCQPDDIIVAVDKDFFQLPYKIYNWVKKELYEPSENPMYYFWRQMLTGDVSDNVEGVPNPWKAHFKKQPKFSDDTADSELYGKSNKEMSEHVKRLYRSAFGDNWFEKFDTNGRLLWLKRSEKDSYHLHV